MTGRVLLSALFALLLALGAWGAFSGGSSPSASAADARGGLPPDPAARPDEAVAAQVGALLRARHAAGTLHGAALVGRGDSVLYAAAFGPADREAARANTLDTRFPIGSLTKQFTAALVLTLVRDGQVALDAPVSTYLPSYAGPGAGRITVHDLLAHRSGLPAHADVRAAARGASAVPLDVEPGTQYAYSNAGYVLLGLLAEAVTGQRYDEALRERVLKPAGVGRAIGYARQAPALEGLATGYVASWWSSGYRRAETVDADGPFAAGGLYATPRALHRWTRALHGGRVLPDSLVALMTTPHSDSGYGYGLFVEETMHGHAPTTVLHHGGGISGFTAALRYVQPAHGPAYTIVVLDNTQSATTVETAEAIQHLLVRPPVEAGDAATG